MDFLNEYWLLIVLALIVLALVAFLALRPRNAPSWASSLSTSVGVSAAIWS